MAVIIAVEIHAANRVLVDAPILIVVDLRDFTSLPVVYAHIACLGDNMLGKVLYKGIRGMSRHPARRELILIHNGGPIPCPIGAIFIKAAVAVIVAGAWVRILAYGLVVAEKNIVAVGIDRRYGVDCARVQELRDQGILAIMCSQIPNKVEHDRGADGLAGVMLAVYIEGRPVVRTARPGMTHTHRHDGPILPRLAYLLHINQLRVGSM